MDHKTEVEIIRRILTHLRDGTTDRGTTERSYPVADYRDEERHTAEMAATLRRMPLIFTHASRLSRPGDYVTDTVLGMPIAVVRRHDGELSAFINVCRHRAAKLLTEEHGTGLRTIGCPYHAWSYDLTGRLAAIPDREGSFPSTAVEAVSLVTLPVAERHGLVWIVLTPQGDIDVSGFLGPLDKDIEGFDFDHFTFYTTESRIWQFNWKTGIEAFLENYHFATLHKRSTSKIFFNNVTILDTFAPHIRAVAPKRSIARLADVGEQEWDLRAHATLLYVLFPNTCLFVEKTHASLLQMLPLEPSQTQVNINNIVARDGLRYREFWDKNIALFMSAVVEDLQMCESMSHGMAAIPGSEINFGRNETGCAIFHDAVDTALVDAALAVSGVSGTVAHLGRPAAPEGSQTARLGSVGGSRR